MSRQIALTTFYRNQIESGDISAFLDYVNSLGILEPEKAEANIIRQLQAKVGFFIDGYNDDTRELFQIPEVRNYIHKVQASWPYGLYFFGGHAGNLNLLILSHIEMKVERQGQSNELKLLMSGGEVDRFIQSATPAIVRLTARIKWTEERAARFLSDVATQFNRGMGGPTADSEEDKRQRHAEFIGSQKDKLSIFAREGFAENGRGAILVTPPDQGGYGCQIVFAKHDMLLNTPGFDSYHRLHEMVAGYDPDKQFVICLLEPDSMDAYTAGLSAAKQDQAVFLTSAAGNTSAEEDIVKFQKYIAPRSEVLAEFGRESYSKFGRGAVVLIMDEYEDLETGDAEAKYASLGNLLKNENFATFETFIKKVKTYDPDVFTVLFVSDRHSARFFSLSLTPQANPAAEENEALTTI
jgi:hypothetical protein